jgi:hypothetical protein
MLLCWATSSITVYIAKKIVSPWPAGECRSDGPPLPISRAGIGVALMPALQKGSGVVNVYISDFDTRI